MLLRELFEGPTIDAAFCFGRFNPAHQGHIEVWKAVEGAGRQWYVGTNPSTHGPNDPLTFQEKSAWMTAIYPSIKGHILAEQSVLTLASKLYQTMGPGKTIAYVTDSQDWAWAGKVLNDYNGKEGAHGFYKFDKITHVESPRVSSATALRTAARAGDKAAFYAASGTNPKLTVNGKTYFDTVVAAVGANPEKVKKPKKVKEPEQGVAEGTSIESTLRAVINDIGEPITNVYDTMKFQAKKYMENHGELDRGFRMVAAGIGGRWVQSMYVGRLQNELYDLCKYNTRRTVELKQFLRGVETDGELEMKRSFGNIANELPRILAKLGQHLDAAQLTKNANRWMQNKAAYEEYIANLELEDDYDEPTVAKSPKNPAIGQQRSQVEDIINDVLSKLPKKIAGDIRNAIARSPNKLQALQAELQKRNVKEPTAEATFKKSPYGRTAASQQRAKELLNPPKKEEPKTQQPVSEKFHIFKRFKKTRK